jgi:hypothetical protein
MIITIFMLLTRPTVRDRALRAILGTEAVILPPDTRGELILLCGM